MIGVTAPFFLQSNSEGMAWRILGKVCRRVGTRDVEQLSRRLGVYNSRRMEIGNKRFVFCLVHVGEVVDSEISFRIVFGVQVFDLFHVFTENSEAGAASALVTEMEDGEVNLCK